MAEKPESDSTVKAYWLWLYIQLLVQKNSVDSLTPELRPNSVCNAENRARTTLA